MMRFTILKAPIPSNRVKPFMAFAQGAQGPIAQAAVYSLGRLAFRRPHGRRKTAVS